MTAILIIVISGIFLNMSLVIEELHKEFERKRRNYETFYEESYKSLRVIAILELAVGIYFYTKEPLDYLFPIDTLTFKLVYHIMICLFAMIIGAWIFQKFYDKIK
jgi:uncharacterized protein (DUF2384 family)